MKFIDYIELKDKSILVRRETTNDFFDKLEQSNLEVDSLVKCRIIKKGLGATERYQEEDLILISADKVRKIKYSDCPEDVCIIYNEDLIFGKVKE